MQNLTTIEVKQSPLFFTRTRGLFRECYPGPKDKAPNHENQGQGDTKKISKYKDEIRKYWSCTIITIDKRKLYISHLFITKITSFSCTIPNFYDYSV